MLLVPVVVVFTQYDRLKSAKEHHIFKRALDNNPDMTEEESEELEPSIQTEAVEAAETEYQELCVDTLARAMNGRPVPPYARVSS